MEFHLLSIAVLSTFLLFLFMVMMIKKLGMNNIYSKTLNPNSKLPPGPSKLPLIGNLHNMLGLLPHHTLRDLARKYGPLMHLQLGELSTIVVSSPEVAEQVMKTHDLIFADRPKTLAAKILFYGCTDVAFSPYGNYWRQLRKISMLELLSTKRIRFFRSIREEEVSNLIRSLCSMAGSPVNLTERIFSLSNDIISRAAIGKKCKDKEALISCMEEGVKLAGGFDIADVFPSLKFLHAIGGLKSKLERVHWKADKILDDIINDHKENRTLATRKTANLGHHESEEDFIDVLLQLQDSGTLEFPFSTDNLKAVILDIFTAGTDTSSTAIDWAMSELVKNPRVMDKVQAEMRRAFDQKKLIDETDIQKLDYLKLVVKETLRLHPPAPLLLPRECKEGCEIDGYKIPVKSRVLVNAWAIGRDPKHWGNDAEKFKPERFDGGSIDYKGTNFEYIPFGAGRRMCPGLSYAIANIELPLAQLLHHFNWKLPYGMNHEDLDMSESFGASVRRKNDLYLIAIPYSPVPTDQ